MRALKNFILNVIDEQALSRSAMAYKIFDSFLVIVGIGGAIAATEPDLPPAAVKDCLFSIGVVWVCFLFDYAARLWVAPHDTDITGKSFFQARMDWIKSRNGLIDLGSVLPMAIALALLDWVPDGAPLLAVFWISRFARYTTGLDMLARVIIRERQPVMGVLLIFVLTMLVAAVLAFVTERQAQPDHFGSLSMAMWWAITTLTTTGYGDAVPVTQFGRLLGGFVMICGITVFGLLAGILATGFGNELKRRDFLRNWDLVAQVPIFHDVGPGTIADLANLLRPRELPGRSIVARRGSAGDCMFFIVSGAVEIQVEPKPVHLGPGDFFGEMALVTGAARNATVVTTTATRLLVLDIADFRALASAKPELLDIIRQEATRRSSAIVDNAAILPA